MTLNIEQLKQHMRDANKQVPDRKNRTYEESPVFVAAKIDGKERHFALVGARVEQLVTGENMDESDPAMYLEAVDIMSLLSDDVETGSATEQI